MVTSDELMLFLFCYGMRHRRKIVLSHVWLMAIPWTVACQAPLSMGFSRPEYWSGLPSPSPADLPDPGIKPGSPALQVDSSPTELSGKTQKRILAPRCSDPPAKKLHKAREGSQGPRERVRLLWGIEGLVQPLSQALMPTRGSKGGKDSSAVTLSTGQLRGLCQEDAQDVPWDFSTCWRRAQSWTKNQHICNWEWEPNTEKLHYQTHQLIFPPWDNSERQQTGDKDAAQSLSS